MKPEVIYQKLVEKLNKNFTNSTISLDKARAVYLFNEEQNKFVEWSISKRNSFLVEDVQNLLSRKMLKKDKVFQNFVTFKIPDNFFHFVNIEVKASNGSCGSVRMLPFRVKPENIQEILSDDFNKPSFKDREVPFTIEDNKIKVFVDGFNIDSLYLNYYRYPKQFNIEGYIDVDNTMSFNSEPEFGDRIIDRIISMCATSFDINNENFNKLQSDINRVASKF